MDVRVGVYLCVHVWVGFFSDACCWFHGHMIPTSCGSDWPGLVFVRVFVLLKSRVVFRKSIALQSSYQLAWESRLLPLKTLVSCILCFKRFWEFHALKDLQEGTLHTGVRSVFLWCMMHTAIKIAFPLAPSCTCRPLCRPWHVPPSSSASPPSSLKAEPLSVRQNYDAIGKNQPGQTAWYSAGGVQWSLKLFNQPLYHQEPDVGKRLTPDLKKKSAELRTERKGLRSRVSYMILRSRVGLCY